MLWVLLVSSLLRFLFWLLLFLPWLSLRPSGFERWQTVAQALVSDGCALVVDLVQIVQVVGLVGTISSFLSAVFVKFHAEGELAQLS